MHTNKSTTYDKIELLVKNYANNMDLPTTTKVTLDNCAYQLLGNYLIITEFIILEEEVTETNRIFNLADISAFKTHKNK